MSEFIVIQVGQCGNQIGSCFLPEILNEYNLINKSDAKIKQNNSEQNISSFFSLSESKASKYNSLHDLIKSHAKAKFLCIDMEESVVYRAKTGRFRDLYDKKCLITNYPGSGNNWAEGHCNHGPKYEERLLNTVQYLVEQCDNLHGFLIIFSVGGGTGSGLGTFLVKLLADHYSHIERFVACVYPIGTEDVITCPYNMAFSTQVLLENATCVFPVENRALLDIVLKQANTRYSVPHPTIRKKVGSNNFGVNNKTDVNVHSSFDDINKIIVDMMMHLTSGCRFSGALNLDMNEINTNMIAFPRLNFLSSGFSPFSFKNYAQSNVSSKQYKHELFLSACHRNNQLIKIDPFDSDHISMSCTILGRGDYYLNDIRQFSEKLQCKLKTPRWSNKTIKLGLCYVPPKGFDYAMFSLFNTTSMSYLFECIFQQFTKLYQRKAHVYHYTNIDGFELDHFEECKVTFNEILDVYQSIDRL